MPENIAIIGMDAHFGSWEGIDAFLSGLYNGQHPTIQIDPAGGWIAPVGSFELDLAAVGISPDDADQSSPAKLLMVKTGIKALQDAGFSQDDAHSENVAIVIVAGEGIPRGASIAPVISAAFDFSGPDMDLSADASLCQALETAIHLLKTDQAAAVLVGAAHLLADRSLGQPASEGGILPTLSYDVEMNAAFSGEGAAALVLKPEPQAIEDGDRIYAVLQAAATSQNGDVAAANRQAFTTASVSPDLVGYLEVSASGDPSLDQGEILGIHEAFAGANGPLSCALGSVTPVIGLSGAASGLASLLKAALCIYHRIIPPVPGWHGPKEASLWQNTPFYVPTESRPWFARSDPGIRYAGVNLLSPDGACTSLILSGKETHEIRSNPLLENEAFRLFPVSGQSPDEILNRLDALQRSALDGASLVDLSSACYQEYRQTPGIPLVLGLVAGQPDELLKEIEFARKGVPKAVERAAEWQTPLGSYFTPAPLGRQGSVAFVYPGAFNSFIGLGKDLFQLFPIVYPGFADITADMSQVLHESALYPRSLAALTSEQNDALEVQLNENPVAMLTSGTSLAVVFTLVLREAFKVKPGAAFGYSLGESSMLFAQQVWNSGDAGSLNLAGSPIFQTRLSGPKNAVREFWGLPPAQDPAAQNGIWKNVLLMAPEEKVIEALQEEDRVYLTHINTPRQVVIAGDPAGCQRVIDRLQCTSLRAPFEHVLHCPPVRLEFDGLVQLHDFATRPPVNGIRLYSAANYAPVQPEHGSIARAIAETLCTHLDFPRLINRVYEDGARLFIELGAGSNCSKWIDDTLKGKPHLAVSINRKGADDFCSIVRLLARLASHQVPMDLSPLYPDGSRRSDFEPALKKTIHF